MSALVVTILGLGEAGTRIAADLVARGVRVRAYDPLAASHPEGVERAGNATAAVTGSDVVLALTTAATAEGAATAALPGLGADAIYADANTAAPAVKRELAALVRAAGSSFADVALLGTVPTLGLETPTLASGVGAQRFAEAFGSLGMPVEVVSDEPGDAAARKLLRSVFMKGLAASALESLHAASAAGQAEWLERELAGVIGEPLFARLLEGSHRHAARRVDEMAAARDLLLELGVEPHITSASAAVLADLAGKAQ
jgi:3-hydroxyisobutyrate dehydrogenase-like beta-hydroxyacid dehydrogenase